MQLLLQSFIASILTTSIILATLHVSISTLKTLKNEANHISKSVYIEESLREIIDDIDTTSLPIQPRIHSRGSITYTDGSPVSISSRLKPHDESNALSSISLNPKSSLWIHSLKRENLSFSAEACFRFVGTAPLGDIRSYLGLSVDGSVLLRGESKRLRSGCREITFRSTRSVVIEDVDINLKSVRVLIPVIREYTFYVDNSRTLRYISHAGDEVLENQPLLDEFPAPFSISLKTPLNGDLYLLFALVGSDTLPIEASNRLLRDSHLSHLLGRP